MGRVRAVSRRCSDPHRTATTSFAYNIAEPEARELVEAGLEELRRSGPLVLAFCPEITEIAVETSDAEWKLSRDSQEEGGIRTIRRVEDGDELSRFVAVAGEEGECCAALQLRPAESGLEVDPAQETAAKLFVLFPLVGSERLGLPATVNSRRFKPREDRDGIVAGGLARRAGKQAAPEGLGAASGATLRVVRPEEVGGCRANARLRHCTAT